MPVREEFMVQNAVFGGLAMARCFRLAPDLSAYDAVTRHHVLDNGVGGLGCRVGDQDAGAGPGGSRRRLHGVVVAALHPGDTGALLSDPPGARPVGTPPCRKICDVVPVRRAAAASPWLPSLAQTRGGRRPGSRDGSRSSNLFIPVERASARNAA
jgi:hypothetical protein